MILCNITITVSGGGGKRRVPTDETEKEHRGIYIKYLEARLLLYTTERNVRISSKRMAELLG